MANESALTSIEKELDDLDGKFLTFYTDQQLFGVPIADVVQIVGMQQIIEIPEFPEYAKGIINLRGTIIPLIDMRLRMQKLEIPYSERTCTIVTSIADAPVGFIVDSVDEVAEIEDSAISPPPQIAGERNASFVVGIAKVGDKVILILDTGKLLGGEEVRALLQS